MAEASSDWIYLEKVWEHFENNEYDQITPIIEQGNIVFYLEEVAKDAYEHGQRDLLSLTLSKMVEHNRPSLSHFVTRIIKKEKQNFEKLSMGLIFPHLSNANLSINDFRRLSLALMEIGKFEHLAPVIEKHLSRYSGKEKELKAHELNEVFLYSAIAAGNQELASTYMKKVMGVQEEYWPDFVEKFRHLPNPEISVTLLDLLSEHAWSGQDNYRLYLWAKKLTEKGQYETAVRIATLISPDYIMNSYYLEDLKSQSINRNFYDEISKLNERNQQYRELMIESAREIDVEKKPPSQKKH